MTEKSTIIQAETIDLAIEEGLRQLGIKRVDAEIRVVKEDKKGFLGLGKQDAIVEVRRKLDISYKELTRELEINNTDSKFATSLNESDFETNSEESEKNEIENQDRETSLEDQRNLHDSEIEEVSEISNEVEEIIEEPDGAEIINKQEPVEEDTEVESSADENKNVDNDIVETIENKKNQSRENLQEAASQVADYLIDIIQNYGAEADIAVILEGKQLIFDIDTDKTGLVIGKHGKIINALQVLAQTLLLSLYPNYMNVVLNVGDYRNRRAHVLEQMAMDAADQVTTTHRPYRFEALPSYERKQIHAHLSKMSHLKTYSEGKEPHRHLIIEYIEK